jgi:hypothetical protein
MIGFIGTSLQLHSIMTAHNQWLSTTRSIPYWTTSVFSSTVTNDESLVTPWTALRVKSYVTTDGRSASVYSNKAPIWGLRPHLYYCQTVAGFFIWGALSDERTGLSFTIAAGWLSPAQSFSGPSPVALMTIFYCLRFETSLFVAVYDSQGYGGGIRPRLHTGLPRVFAE